MQTWSVPFLAGHYYMLYMMFIWCMNNIKPLVMQTWWQNHGSLSSQQPPLSRTWKPRHRRAGNQWNFLIQERKIRLFLRPVGNKERKKWPLAIGKKTVLEPCWGWLSCTWWCPSPWWLSQEQAESLVEREPTRAQTWTEGVCVCWGGAWYTKPGKCYKEILPWQQLPLSGWHPENKYINK